MKKITTLCFMLVVLQVSVSAVADCPNVTATCTTEYNQYSKPGAAFCHGKITYGTCWHWAAMKCESCSSNSTQNAECNSKYPSCNGSCQVLVMDYYNCMHQSPYASENYRVETEENRVKNCQYSCQTWNAASNSCIGPLMNDC